MIRLKPYSMNKTYEATQYFWEQMNEIEDEKEEIACSIWKIILD